MFDTIDSIQCIVDVFAMRSGLIGLFSGPGFGKTSLMMYFCHKLSETGKKSLVLTFELTERQWFSRMHVFEMRTDNVVIYDDWEWRSIDKIKEAIMKEQPDMVFIDYLELLELNVQHALIELKKLQESLSVSILVSGKLARITGDYDIEERRPELFDLLVSLGMHIRGLKESEKPFALTWQAFRSLDLILLLHRPNDCFRWVGIDDRNKIGNDAELIPKYCMYEYHLPKTCKIDFRVFMDYWKNS